MVPSDFYHKGINADLGVIALSIQNRNSKRIAGTCKL